MPRATITIRDLANGRLAVKLNLDSKECPTSPAHKVATSFLAWLASHQPQQPVAQPATTAEGKNQS